MNKIVSMEFGSRLYGTATPASDVDVKSIYLPNAEQILLERAKNSIAHKRPKSEKEKNFAGELDDECYSLKFYLELVSQGQTVAMDMLFAPESSLLETSQIWKNIVNNREFLISKRPKAFISYCMNQAKKYGIKGSRVAAVRATLNFLTDLYEENSSFMKLGEKELSVRNFVSEVKNEFISIVTSEQNSGLDITFLEICGRKLSYRSSIKEAISIVQHLMDEYGKRALMAETNEGVDWKAVSHAIRITEQAIELFQTGFITFPRPNADYLRNIKLGNYPYSELAEYIEDLLPRVEEEAKKSSLPDNVNHKWIDTLIKDVYGDEIVRSYLKVR